MRAGKCFDFSFLLSFWILGNIQKLGNRFLRRVAKGSLDDGASGGADSRESEVGAECRGFSGANLPFALVVILFRGDSRAAPPTVVVGASYREMSLYSTKTIPG